MREKGHGAHSLDPYIRHLPLTLSFQLSQGEHLCFTHAPCPDNLLPSNPEVWIGSSVTTGPSKPFFLEAVFSGVSVTAMKS